VRIYDPATDEFAWVDLAEREFERVSTQGHESRRSAGS
jgi:hypothetical protein